MNILIAVAHDLTCDKGNEWLFRNLADNKEDLEDLKKKSGDDIEDVKIDIISLCIIIAFLAIGFGIYFLFKTYLTL